MWLTLGLFLAVLVLSELLRPRPRIEQGTGPRQKVKTGLFTSTWIGTERYPGESDDRANPYRGPGQ